MPPRVHVNATGSSSRGNNTPGTAARAYGSVTSGVVAGPAVRYFELVSKGMVDAYVDCSVDAHGPWDYLGGVLVCQEAGAAVVDLHGRPLVARAHSDRRTPVAAATPALLDEVVAAIRKIS